MWYQNSDRILPEKQNSSHNFNFERRVGADNDVCMEDNSRRISEFSQNSAGKTKFLAELWFGDKDRCG